MRTLILTLLLTVSCLATASLAICREVPCFREEFNNLDQWKPLLFAKIAKHTSYSIEQDGATRVLRAKANGSASGLVYVKTFDIRQCRVITWRWKVRNVYARGDAKSKKGDDYPLRIYVLFKYDPARAGFAKRLQYDLIKTLRGEYPPDSSLNYIWANRQPIGTVMANAYTDRAMMLVMESGSGKTDTWVTERVDALADYRRAFGHEPPAEATLAVMSDADDTGESATAWLDYIAVSPVSPRAGPGGN